MAAFLTNFRYYPPGGERRLGGYVRYMALREGAELCDDSRRYAPATAAQKRLVGRVLRDCPDARLTLEYEEYRVRPTVGSARTFLARALEGRGAAALARPSYADCLGDGPGVPLTGAHGLFTDEGRVVALSRAAAELDAHEGNVWSLIAALRREDAERLGYASARSWQLLLRSHTLELADALRIPLRDLKWYAAFHNGTSHPHVHVIAYADDPRVGYLSRTGIRKLRAALGADIFRDDGQRLLRERTAPPRRQGRDLRAFLDRTVAETERDPGAHPDIEAAVSELADRLTREGTRPLYGYLKRDAKVLTDRIVDLLAGDRRIAALYELWYERRYERLLSGAYEAPPRVPLSRNRTFRSVRNDVVRGALRIRPEGAGDARPPGEGAPPPIGGASPAEAVAGLLQGLAGVLRNGIVEAAAAWSQTADRPAGDRPAGGPPERREAEEEKAEIGLTM